MAQPLNTNLTPHAVQLCPRIYLANLRIQDDHDYDHDEDAEHPELIRSEFVGLATQY